MAPGRPARYPHAMPVRHIAAVDNVDGGFVIDPTRVRHGVLVEGRVRELAGEIDVATHLNLDFDEHRLGDIVVVEALVAGSPALRDAEAAFVVVRVNRASYARLGPVDVGGRRAEWLTVLRERRDRARSE